MCLAGAGSLGHLFLIETSQTIEASLFTLWSVKLTSSEGNHMPTATRGIKGKAEAITIWFHLNTRGLISLPLETS